MKGGFVKICGISTVEAAESAIDSGASAIGFIFADSLRKVGAEQVRAILDAVDHRNVKTVGVFVNPDVGMLSHTITSSGIDVVQLAGDEAPDQLTAIEAEVWKVLRFEPDILQADAKAEMERWIDRPRPPSRMLIDAFVPGVYGGSGQTANWSLATTLSRAYPLTLAGGLTPDNVADAIGTVQPNGVDVSSGVEVDGVKDRDLIGSFIRSAREAFSRN